MIRFLLVLLFCSIALPCQGQLFRRGSGYGFDASSNTYNYKGRQYRLGIDGPVSSTCQCSMCQRLRAALQSSTTSSESFNTPVFQPPSVESTPAIPNVQSMPLEVLTAFDPTPVQAVNDMLDLVGVGPGDVLFDPGCGDGRIVVEAAKRGALAYGVEINEETAKVAYSNTKDIENAQVFLGDALTAHFYDANIVTVFLYPEVIKKLVPRFLRMPDGTTVVSHAHDLPGLPTTKHTVNGVDFYIWVKGETWRQYSLVESE